MLHPDLKDLLSAFADASVEYLLVGGYAVGFYSRPRATKDIDLWIRGTEENLARTCEALTRFGAAPAIVQALRDSTSEDIVWFGIAPTRVDILRRIEGVEFDPAYERRTQADWEGTAVSIIGIDDLIAAKRAAGRGQDLRDVRALERAKA
jgi:hypothetical protein